MSEAFNFCFDYSVDRDPPEPCDHESGVCAVCGADLHDKDEQCFSCWLKREKQFVTEHSFGGDDLLLEHDARKDYVDIKGFNCGSEDYPELTLNVEEAKSLIGLLQDFVSKSPVEDTNPYVSSICAYDSCMIDSDFKRFPSLTANRAEIRYWYTGSSTGVQ